MSKGEKILTGAVIETRSSNAYLERRIEQLRAQTHGTGPVQEVIVDTLEPISVVSQQKTMDSITVQTTSIQVLDGRSPVHLHEVRGQKIIAKNTGDKLALEEIRKAA